MIKLASCIRYCGSLDSQRDTINANLMQLKIVRPCAAVVAIAISCIRDVCFFGWSMDRFGGALHCSHLSDCISQSMCISWPITNWQIDSEYSDDLLCNCKERPNGNKWIWLLFFCCVRKCRWWKSPNGNNPIAIGSITTTTTKTTSKIASSSAWSCQIAEAWSGWAGCLFVYWIWITYVGLSGG